MPQIEAPNQATIDDWGVEPLNVRAGDEPSETLEVDASTAQLSFICNYEYRFEVAKWIVGYADTYLDGSDTYLSRLLPQRHPDRENWIATKITEMRGHQWVEMVEEDGKLPRNAYAKCKLTVMFEHAPYELVADDPSPDETGRYVENPAESEPGGEYLTLPGAALKYVADPEGDLVGEFLDGKPVAQNVGVIVPQNIIRIKWHRLPESVWVPGAALYERVFGTDEGAESQFFGATNTLPVFGYPTGCLLFTGVRPVRRKSPTGVGFEWDITYELTYKPTGWNWALGYAPGYADSTGWYMLSVDGEFYTADSVPDNKSVYRARDLNKLFQVG